jgi:hypothetical protein
MFVIGGNGELKLGPTSPGRGETAPVEITSGSGEVGIGVEYSTVVRINGVSTISRTTTVSLRRFSSDFRSPPRPIGALAGSGATSGSSKGNGAVGSAIGATGIGAGFGGTGAGFGGTGVGAGSVVGGVSGCVSHSATAGTPG